MRAADAKVRLSHVRALFGAFEAQRDTAKVGCSHHELLNLIVTSFDARSD